MEEAKLTIRTSAEAEVEDTNKAEDSKEEDSTTKAEALTTMEEDSKEEDSTTKDVGLEEAEATSTQMTSASKNHLVFQMIPAPLQSIKRDSSPTGTAVATHRTLIRAATLTTITQTKDGTDN